MTRTTTEILQDLAIENEVIQNSLARITEYVLELAVKTIEPEVEPPIDPPIDPPVIEPPVVGPNLQELQGHWGKERVATEISNAPKGTKFDCFGEFDMIQIGGILGDKPGKMDQVAHHADGSPITDLTFSANNGVKLRGLRLHNSHGGFDGIDFQGFLIEPSLDGDRAAIMCEEHFHEDKFQGGLLSLQACSIKAPEHFKAFGGYGMKQGIILRSSRFEFDGLQFSPPKEHPIYCHNIMGESYANSVGCDTRFLPNHLGELVEVGPGRTLFQVQERRSDGLESYGNILFTDAFVRRCGSEGVLAGNTASGGSALTVGGHNGTVTYHDILIDEPMTGGVIVAWMEAKNGVPKGFRDPATTRVEYDNVKWTTCMHPLAGHRTPIKISSVGSLLGRNVGLKGEEAIADPWNSPHVKLNSDPSDAPLYPQDVDWQA